MLSPELNVSDLLEILSADLVNGSAKILSRRLRISLDSRTTGKGEVFWPIAGERFDGHKFIAQAVLKGAIMAVVDEARIAEVEGVAYVPVRNTGEALLRLARGYAARCPATKVAITGSNGKTTTKEMVRAVLSRKGSTLATEGNLNNHVGVPMTLFQLRKSHEFAVVEMGTSGPGEIKPLSLAANPGIAVITCVGPSHLEGLGSVEGVYKEKASIAAGLRKGGVLVVNADDPFLCRLRSTSNYRVVTFGIHRGQYHPDEVRWDEDACASFRMGRTWFHLKAPGIHNLSNALAAVTVGILCRVPRREIAAGIASFRAAPMRMEIRAGRGIKVVADCYNANPSSVRSAIETVSQARTGGRRIAVLADMLELGPDSRRLHGEIGTKVAESGFDWLLATGPDSLAMVDAARAGGIPDGHAKHFADRDALTSFLSGLVHKGDLLLVKGSRGMHLETVVEHLLAMEPTEVKP